MPDVGVMLNNLEPDRLRAFGVAAGLGFRVVHASGVRESWLTGPQRSAYVAAARDSGLVVHTLFAGFDGQSYSDLPSVRRTVGLVLPESRERRRLVALTSSDLARDVGASALGAHVGFVPHDPGHPDYSPLVRCVREVADRCRENGIGFHLETGQEPAAVLLRFLIDVDRPNVGVNFDPANLLLYDTDEPLRALDLLAPFVRGAHCKDGVRPSTPDKLGSEVPFGEGDVGWPVLLPALLRLGYTGPLVIEREHGPSVADDVMSARARLLALLSDSGRP